MDKTIWCLRFISKQPKCTEDSNRWNKTGHIMVTAEAR